MIRQFARAYWKENTGGGIAIPDYKELYFQLFRRTEQARRILEQAQQEAEDAYLREGDAPLRLSGQGPPAPEADAHGACFSEKKKTAEKKK